MKKFLIVGLGNIGLDYVQTRHNIGFMLLDYMSHELGFKFEELRYGSCASHSIKGKNVFFLKPNTYMNLSGKAVKYWMEKENILIENVLIITDDLNIDFGAIRIKSKGSDGGHNGLKSLQNELQTVNYPRLRFGIGDKFSKGRQVDYVLGQWGEEERKFLPERLEVCSKAVQSFVIAGINETMNQFNGK
jgi:PTH1 family peptidyl-tRNA hydrolase